MAPMVICRLFRRSALQLFRKSGVPTPLRAPAAPPPLFCLTVVLQAGRAASHQPRRRRIKYRRPHREELCPRTSRRPSSHDSNSLHVSTVKYFEMTRVKEHCGSWAKQSAQEFSRTGGRFENKERVVVESAHARSPR